MKEKIDIPKLVDELSALHATSCENLRKALGAYINQGIKPDPVARAAGAFCYPEIRVVYAPETASWPSVNRAFARMNGPGAYAVSVTRPNVFRDYLIEQLTLLSEDYDVDIEIGLSSQEMPYPYVLDGSQDLPIDQAGAAELSRWFPTSTLADIGDEVPDGVFVPTVDAAMPLALFDAPRVDFSLKRLQHYTGAPAEHTQSFILFTNYHRYVDEFVRWAAAELKQPGTPYTGLSCSGNVMVDASTPDPEDKVASGAWRRHQMPAYHLMAPGGQGITLVNIGVGPSNAKTICDHLAVLRPQAWLMIGHCGGLRGSQKLGDYVLAHAYLRDDHVLDHVLPIEIPIPPIAEVQQAMQKAAEIVTGETREQLKTRLRTGTIVTTDDRNWELRYALSAVRFNQSRAVGIDMESATISAQGYRFRVPYGTLLCVSDKPLHGEIKLPGQANRFYEQAIGQHLKIGIEAVALLRQEGPRLHSRKLRAFDEPPFR